ncbi:hypothetical protein HMH01_02795 [Halovulum dunhuangense]|uniref:7(1) septoil knot domain-containing protein n=1 Tax=Halovulum dunhuangense TaxID=1505036 RepID=A0A849KXM4_9RHOB|nr:DUF6150 family protein [Halovulum dunhuangense]NNU79357.1 hypothetical protein [Halovulum dunhuangense]
MTRVFAVPNPNYANITVEVIQSRALADLLVYRNDKAVSEAHDESIWTFVEQRQNAHIAVYFTHEGRGMAHLRIAYVPNATLAGWMKHHRLRGRLNRRHPELALG